MIVRRFAAVLFAFACCAASAGTLPAAQPSPLPAPTPSAVPSPSSAPSSTPAPLPSPAASGTPPAGVPAAAGLLPPGLAGGPGAPQPYAQFVRNAESQSGLIDIVKKDDEVYFDLGADQFDRPFIVAPVLASGVGSEAFAGRVFPSFILEFKRVGRRVLWVVRNADFSAPANSTAANALAISVTDSVINSTPIVAEDQTKRRVVVSAAFFLTDFENVGRDLAGPQGPIILLGAVPRPGFTVDASKSYLEKTKAFPRNDEILASLAFAGPPGQLSGAPDARGVRLRMHYSLLAAPASGGYVPRLADDRVGYFITAQKRFDNDALATPFLRYIDRWNFNNGPIVYYLTNEIPVEYKAPIRRALLQWKAAFAAIGIPGAVEVRDQPSDPNWDPDDARYSTVRWITSDRAAFSAYGPHVEDPRTGEILRVEIVIDGEALRTVKRGYSDQIVPARSAAKRAAGLPVPVSDTAVRCDDSGTCDAYQAGSAEMAAGGTVALRALGATRAQSEEYARQWLQSVVLHESGHNFGLRHNFKSATLYSLAQIHDKRFTQVHGLVGSVMGYTPVNLSPPHRPQGDYFQLRLGPYDRWAIRYGYERFANVRRPDDERIALRGIAQESSRPDYAYATDEDANGFLAIDPRVATYHLSRDPLTFVKNQFTVYDDLVSRLDGVYPRDDRPYYEERRTFQTMMRQYERAAMLATKYIGGIYTSRDHRGQRGGEAPERPVPRADSQRAFALLASNIFSSKAFRFSPQLLRDLGPNHYLHRGVDEIERSDFAVEDYVAGVQDDVMFALYSPEALSRIASERYKAEGNRDPMQLEDVFAWTGAAVWDDLRPRAPGIDPLHRALQRRYTNLMIAFALAPSFLIDAIGYPSDTPSLARYQLRNLAGGVSRALRSQSLDVSTRAHLEDIQSRVRHALAPNAVRGA